MYCDPRAAAASMVNPAVLGVTNPGPIQPGICLSVSRSSASLVFGAFAHVAGCGFWEHRYTASWVTMNRPVGPSIAELGGCWTTVAVVPFAILYPAVYVNPLDASSFAARSASADRSLAGTSTPDEGDENESTRRATPPPSVSRAATAPSHLLCFRAPVG